MMEEKMYYIAPEVEIICFAPVENLAAESWGWSPYGAGTGSVPDASDPTLENGGAGGDDVDEGDSD